MKQRRERKHNSIEVENKIIYGDSVANKSRAENLLHFRHYTIDVAYFGFVDLCQPLNFLLCI